MAATDDWAPLGAKPHLAVAAGAVGAASGLTPEQTALSLVYTTMTGSATAAQRLLALDPGDVAALTFELSPLCEQTAAEAAKELADLSDPLLDVLAQRHAERDRPALFVFLKGPPCHHICIDGEPHGHADRPRRVRHAGEPLRIGIGGPGRLRQDRAGGRAVPAAARRAVARGADQRHLHHRGRRLPAPHAVLPDERIAAVQTGGCPHTAIRDDITANLDAIDDLIAGNPRLDLILVESGGDNLTATFSSGLVDVQIFVVDVAGGDKVPRKGGPGVTFSDLLVINKTDLAPMVGADLDVMRRDAAKVRGDRPFVLISLTEDPTAAPVLDWVHQQLRVPV